MLSGPFSISTTSTENCICLNILSHKGSRNFNCVAAAREKHIYMRYMVHIYRIHWWILLNSPMDIYQKYDDYHISGDCAYKISNNQRQGKMTLFICSLDRRRRGATLIFKGPLFVSFYVSISQQGRHLRIFSINWSEKKSSPLRATEILVKKQEGSL